jgi:glycine/D-amino acid oxidase-like deaminating enzyme
MHTNADIVVIGGGITGCALFYELSRASLGKVVLVEAGRIAGATTGESGGYTRRFNLDPEVARLSSESFDYYQNFEREVGGSCGFVQTGLATRISMSMLNKAVGQIDELKSAGHQIFISTKPPRQSLSMPLHADNGTVFIYEPQLGYIDTKLACLNWVEAASKNGAKAFEYTKVLSIIFDNDSVVGVVTDKGVIKSKIVVLAAGAWSRGLLEKMPVHTESLDARSFQYNIYLGAGKYMDTAFMDNVDGFYIAPARDGNVFAGILNVNKLVDKAVVFDHTVDYLQAERLHQLVRGRYRWADSVNRLHARTSYDAFTDDQRGQVKSFAQLPGLVLAAGWSAGGIKTAPAIAKQVVDMVSCKDFVTGGIYANSPS